MNPAHNQQTLLWLSGISPILVLLLGAWLKRALDKATVDKTGADAEAARASAAKTRAESDSIVLASARALIEQAKAQQAERDAHAAEKAAVSEERIRTLTNRLNRMEDHFARMRSALATHGVWDASALVDLREHKPDYPSPPPFPGGYDDHAYDDGHTDGADYFGRPTRSRYRTESH